MDSSANYTVRHKWSSNRSVYTDPQKRTKIGRPLIITSGARCDKHNKAVGGAIKSQHIEGLAVGIKVTPIEAYEIVKIAMELGFKGIGIHHQFVHLDLRAGVGTIWKYTV